MNEGNFAREYFETEFDLGNLLIALNNGKLLDMIYLHDGKDDIGAIYLGKLDRPIKGLGGAFIDVGQGQKFFFRSKKNLAEGAVFPVQIQQSTIDGKPPRVTDVIDFQGVFLVLTPDRPGINQSRAIAKLKLAEGFEAKISAKLPKDCGLIFRSDSRFATEAEILHELEGLIAQYQTVINARNLGMIQAALTGEDRVRKEWGDGGFEKVKRLPDYVYEAMELALKNPLRAAGGSVFVEKTRALIAIDIDTGLNTAPTAGRDVNMKALAEICNYLSIMGMAGQFCIDPAPMPVQARKGFETAFASAAKRTGLKLNSRGFGPLGLYEGSIAYARRPIDQNAMEKFLNGA